jgi:hypothetical protein
MMDRGTVRNVEFHFQNKSEKLVHLVGFIISKYILNLAAKGTYDEYDCCDLSYYDML